MNETQSKAPTQAEPAALSAAGVARLLGISQTHLFDLKKEGKFGPSPVRLGRAVRYSMVEVLAWFNAGSPDRATWAKRRAG